MLTGSVLLHAVAERVVARYVRRTGADVSVVDPHLVGASGSVDMMCDFGAQRQSLKVKADAYFGSDPAKIADRELTFYRPETAAYAFESISDASTREPGWMFSSPADSLYYYRLALSQSEAEVAALLHGPDEILFPELVVERDELRILPMRETREWFEQNYDRYAPRPVRVGEHTAWFRLIPHADLDGAVPVRVVGPIFASVLASL